MNEKSLEIKNYWNGDYVLSSSDLIAVKAGLKKSTRVECLNIDDFKIKNKDFKKHNLIAVSSSDVLFGKFNVYISKLKRYALEAKECDPSYKIIKNKKSFNDVVEDVERFSELISYPPCCINQYVKSTLQGENLNFNKTFLRIPNRIPFVFNNMLNGVSNIFISFHVPCSFSCKNTLDYNQKIFNAIKKISPSFAQEIEKLLRRPYLIFLQPQLSAYASWDMRKGFMFKGEVKKNELVYSESLYFKTNYPDYKKNKNTDDLVEISQTIQKGDRIKFDSSGFIVYLGKKKIGKFLNSNELKSFLFNFV
jgi:hypothetical protein